VKHAASPLLFITGASSGIGQALALRFRAAGWRLALAARREDELRRFVQAQGCAEGDAQVYAADVADAASITAAGRACIERQGVPDAVIANAGRECFIRNLKLARINTETRQRSRGPQAAQRTLERLLSAECLDRYVGATSRQAFHFSDNVDIAMIQRYICAHLLGHCQPVIVSIDTDN